MILLKPTFCGAPAFCGARTVGRQEGMQSYVGLMSVCRYFSKCISRNVTVSQGGMSPSLYVLLSVLFMWPLYFIVIP